MARQQPLSERISERRPLIDLLISDFGRFVDAFDQNRQFSGPSLYFHVKALTALRAYGSATDAMDDNDFFDYMYATLASWRLHRMGPGKAKLGEMEDLKSSFREQRQRIEQLQTLRIDAIAEDDVGDVAGAIWQVLQGLRVGIGETLLVANSKALHHLLPDLVPPIDRNYTLMFFVGRPYIYRGRDGDYFKALFPLFREIALRCREDIDARIRTPWEGMNTSVTKVIDNAILGFMPLQAGPDG
jgi:hypothetical protein